MNKDNGDNWWDYLNGQQVSRKFEDMVSDIPEVSVKTDTGARGDSIDLFWEIEGHRRVRRRPGEAQGRKRSSAHLPPSGRPTKRPGFKLLRPRRVSRELPIGEEQEGSPEVRHKGWELHSGTPDCSHARWDGTNSMDCSEELSEGGSDGGSDRDSGDEREELEGSDPISFDDISEFNRFNTDLRTSYRQRLDNLCQSFRMGQNQTIGAQRTNQQGQDYPRVQLTTPSIIRQPRGPTSVVQLNQVQWNHTGRHGVPAVAKDKPDPLVRHRDAPCPPRPVPNCEHTCWYTEDLDDQPGSPGGSRPTRSGYCKACYHSTLVWL